MFLRWAAGALHRRILFPSQTVVASRHAKMANASAASLSSKMEYLNQYGFKGSTWRDVTRIFGSGFFSLSL